MRILCFEGQLQTTFFCPAEYIAFVSLLILTIWRGMSKYPSEGPDDIATARERSLIR